MAFPNTYASDGSLYILKNNFATTLNGGLTAGAASATLTSSSPLPQVGYITVESEAIKYTANATATGVLSGLTRGADSTSAATHANGTIVYGNFVADHHNVLKDEIILIEQSLVQKLGSGTATVVIPSSITAVTVNPATTFNSSTTFGGASMTVNSPVAFNSATSFNGTMTTNTTTVHNGPVTFNTTTTWNTTTSIKGDVAGGEPTAGYVGEYISASATTMTIASSAVYFDIATLSITAGDWDVSALGDFARGSASFTAVAVEFGIGTTAGNSALGLITGQNYLIFSGPNTLTFSHISLSIPTWRINTAAATTRYLKGYTAAFSGAVYPNVSARISARRVR